AERNPAGVFGVMATVAESGADLAEFAGGLSEVLRAVVMHHYGTAPEGLPESTRRLVAGVAPRIGPEDGVRMLKLLGEAEPGIRPGANPRIALETLLLRWAMMDRAADLRAVLTGAPPAGPVITPSATAGSAPATSRPITVQGSKPASREAVVPATRNGGGEPA